MTHPIRKIISLIFILRMARDKIRDMVRDMTRGVRGVRLDEFTHYLSGGGGGRHRCERQLTCIDAPEGCRHATRHTKHKRNGTAYIRGTYSKVHTDTHSHTHAHTQEQTHTMEQGANVANALACVALSPGFTVQHMSCSSYARAMLECQLRARQCRVRSVQPNLL
jgi:hypothetical protein